MHFSSYLKIASKYAWLCVFVLILLLAGWRQRRINNFGCEICADKAGYYMYLPALFGLGFHADNYPSGFDKLHGDGFHLEQDKNIVKTKFTCGVALLLLPFFALGFFIAKIFTLGVSFYSGYYLFFINAGAAFYATLGLYFFKRWLETFVDTKSAIITLALTFFGTHLLYYALDETLMTHVYSFALFSVILFSAKKYSAEDRFGYFLLFTTALAAAILIRPTNVLFGVIALLADIRQPSDFFSRIRRFLSLHNIAAGVLILFLIFLPQFLYWKFAFGRYVVWSYEGEGFPYAKNPWLLTVWFAPQSGIFPYAPILLLSLGFAIVMLAKKMPNALLVLATFLGISYLCASWSDPFFGMCNFGKRPMVEYLPVLMLPIAFLIHDIRAYRKPLQITLSLLIAFFVYYTVALFHAFDTCFFGDPWDWSKFGDLVSRALI